MEKVLLILIVFTILGFPMAVFAKNISVDISGNAAGSKNSVSVMNNQSNGQSTTDVRVESNGQVKTFHTEGNQNINWQSQVNGTRIEVSTEVNNQNSSNQTISDGGKTPPNPPNPPASPKLDLFQLLQKQLSALENLFRSIFR